MTPPRVHETLTTTVFRNLRGGLPSSVAESVESSEKDLVFQTLEQSLEALLEGYGDNENQEGDEEGKLLGAIHMDDGDIVIGDTRSASDVMAAAATYLDGTARNDDTMSDGEDTDQVDENEARITTPAVTNTTCFL